MELIGAGTQIGLLIREDVAFVVGDGLLIEVVIRMEVRFVIDSVEGTGVTTNEAFDALCTRKLIPRFTATRL